MRILEERKDYTIYYEEEAIPYFKNLWGDSNFYIHGQLHDNKEEQTMYMVDIVLRPHLLQKTPEKTLKLLRNKLLKQYKRGKNG